MTPQPGKRRGRPPAGDARATRERILRAAREAFARQGYREATNRQIAAAAGVTPSALYHHFPAKPQLYYAVLEEAEAEIARAIDGAIEPAQSLRQQLGCILQAFADLHERDPSLAAFGAGISLESLRNPELRTLLENPPMRIQRQFEALLLRARERGEISDAVATERIIQMMFAVTTGLSWSGLRHKPAEHRAMLEAFGAILDGSLFP